MARHPVNAKIKAAVDLLERHDMEVTPASVKVNVEKDITWADWTPERAASEALDRRIQDVLRREGYVVSDSGSSLRKNFWDARIPDLEEQLDVKRTSSEYDRVRLKADEAVLTFLREKEKELSYAVYPGLFEADIDRIYRMNGLEPPGARQAA